MAIPDNSTIVGFHDDPDRSVWVPTVTYEAFLGQIKTVLANPAPIKNMVRARVSAMLGPAFDGETDEWVFYVCALGQFGTNALTPEEVEKLSVELLPEP